MHTVPSFFRGRLVSFAGEVLLVEATTAGERRFWLLPLLVAGAITLFVLDLMTPIGMGVFTFYVLPVLLASLQARPSGPLFLAGLSSVFMLGGLAWGQSGVALHYAVTSRSAALLLLWIAAFIARRVVIAREELARATWVKEGTTDLAIAVRGELSVEDVSSQALAFIAPKVKAVVGVAFRRDSNGHFVRLGTYAFTNPHQRPDSFAPGEGLVGQAGRENRRLESGPLPDDYLVVSSALGNAPVRYVIAQPLSADGELVGVVELGFLKPPPRLAAAFLDEVKELLGIAIRSALHRARLRQLLDQEREQAARLQEQGEELRVTNEELAEQTRALQESKTRLENQQVELEQSNQQLEQQAETLEQQKAALDERNLALEKAQGDLRAKTEELERANRYKSEFLASMSHELRTPLNSALILARLLSDNREGNLSEEQVRWAETIYAAGNDLLALINDVLDLSKIEAGRMEVTAEPFALGPMLETLERAFDPPASEAGLEFSLALASDLPETIVTDQRRLEQILRNLLSNAIKFTPKGGRVSVDVRPHPEGVAFAVSDTGQGIPPQKKEAVFEAFRQLDASDTRAKGGTGLGLPISRELASLLGGRIELQSEVGKGSTFTLVLPLAFRPEKSSPAVPAVPGAPPPRPPGTEPSDRATPAFSFSDDRDRPDAGERRLLIVEDDERFARILFQMAHEAGFQAFVAPGAEEGFSLAVTRRPDAIVLDVRLPDENGLALLDRLKTSPDTRHIPVHVISAEDFSRTALELGAIGHLQKPVSREQLQQVFDDLERRTANRVRSVLVVEDDPVHRDSVTRLVGGEQVNVEGVGTAAEALEKLAARSWDCMVLDLTLPDLSGFELLDRLAEPDSPYSHPPVVVYTGRELSREEEERLRAHSETIIIKGARSPERLLDEVTLFLHRVESELPAERRQMLERARSRQRTLEGRKVLVVDDDARNVFALTSALERQGAKTEIARNGREALAKLDEVRDIDLVLMDVMMPEMDGYEATRRIREREEFRRLPIIAVTAKAMRDDRERAFAAGANDYLPKPVDLDRLLSLVRVWMPRRRELWH